MGPELYRYQPFSIVITEYIKVAGTLFSLFIARQRDTSYSTVCFQIIDDDAIVPGWEGKIVAWIEEDVGIKSVGHQDMG